MDRRADSVPGIGVDGPWDQRSRGLGELPPGPGEASVEPRAERDAAEEGAAPPVLDAGGYLPDPEALRGTRFEFGGRRPYRFPTPASRSSQRPLPGVGTVALGTVRRIVPYGAFIDFLGFRGLVHISQLLPGQRVARVEDVVQLGDEVVVRVIGVDPERRHINLSLVPSAPGVTGPHGSHGVPARPAPPAPPVPELGDAPPAGRVAMAADEQMAPVPELGAPGATAPKEAPPAPPVAEIPIARPPRTEPPAGPSPIGPSGAVPPARGRLASPVAAVAAATPPPNASAGRTKPGPATPPEVAPGAWAAGKRRVRPNPAVSQHASRTVHREITDPSHPMARLLAAAREEALRPLELQAPPVTPPPAMPKAEVTVEYRPVHVAEPEPEPEPEASAPVTLEALAARYSHRHAEDDRGPAAAGATHPVPRSARERSKKEREKQAAILARLRAGQ